MSRKLVVLLAVVIIAALLAGCSQQPPAPSPSPAPKPSPAQSPTPAATPKPSPSPTPVVSQQPKRGGTLTVPVSTQAAGYDLHLRPSYGPLYALPIFNNLIRIDPTKQEITTANISPDLAEKWEASADGKVLTFYLRKNVKWHDGTAFTADDVVYSVEKMMDAKRSSLSATFSAFDRVEKVDASTVKIYLKNASASFVMMLAAPYAIIESKAKAGIDSRSTDFLMGTGPFKFKSFTSGVGMELVRNADYFKKDAAYLDGISLKVIPDQAATLDAFITKRTDMTGTISGIRNMEEMDRVTGQAKGAVIDPRSVTRGTRIWLNLNSTPALKDARVRRALGMMVDTRGLVVASQGNTDWAIFDCGLFAAPYSLPGTDIQKMFSWNKPWDERAVEAKKLMADAGYASGLKLRMMTPSSPTNNRKLQFIADMWRRSLNIEPEIVTPEATQARKQQFAGDFDIFFGDSSSVLGDPDEDAAYYVTGASENFLKYSNPEVDKLFAQQSAALDTAKRIQITQQIERQIFSDVVIIPTAGSKQFMAWWPYVKGYVQQWMTYGPSNSFEVTWLDK